MISVFQGFGALKFRDALCFAVAQMLAHLELERIYYEIGSLDLSDLMEEFLFKKAIELLAHMLKGEV